MQIVLERDEAWSLMSVITSHIIDRSGVEQGGKQQIRRWRSDRGVESEEMGDLAEAMNDALAAFMGAKTTRQIKRKGRYMSSRERRGVR
jgi:hypothetical protein